MSQLTRRLHNFLFFSRFFHFSLNNLSPTVRNSGRNGNCSLSFDDTNSQHLKTATNQKSRKSSAHLPVPCHIRAASTPSQIDTTTKDQLISHHKRYPSSIEPFTLNKEHSHEKLECTKKLSLDSNLTKRTSSVDMSPTSTSTTQSKRNSSGATIDSRRLSSGVSRTPSERSVVSHTTTTSDLSPVTPVSSTHNKGPSLLPTQELLAELLKGSSERLATEQRQLDGNIANSGGLSSGSGSNILPTAVLRCLVSSFF